MAYLTRLVFPSRYDEAGSSTVAAAAAVCIHVGMMATWCVAHEGLSKASPRMPSDGNVRGNEQAGIREKKQQPIFQGLKNGKACGDLVV